MSRTILPFTYSRRAVPFKCSWLSWQEVRMGRFLLFIVKTITQNILFNNTKRHLYHLKLHENKLMYKLCITCWPILFIIKFIKTSEEGKTVSTQKQCGFTRCCHPHKKYIQINWSYHVLIWTLGTYQAIHLEVYFLLLRYLKSYQAVNTNVRSHFKQQKWLRNWKN